MREYVCGFIHHRGSVVLIEKKNPEWQRGKLNGVGGKVERGELPHAAMVREAFEEAGLVSEAGNWQHRLTLTTDHGSVVHFFSVDMPELIPLTSSDEGRVAWYELAGLPANAIHNLGWVIRLCLDAETPGPLVLNYPGVTP